MTADAGPGALAAESALAFEVWGDPIDHSLSPRIHRAAYAVLGWDWTYGRRRVDVGGFTREIDALDAPHRGLSLTFPLKAAAFARADTRDRTAELTGAVNTLVRAGGALHGYNTDVGGLAADIRAQGVDDLDRARIVGAGSTATSALVALGDLGAREIEIVARRPEAAAALVDLGARLGMQVSVTAPEAVASASTTLTVSTLPGGAALPGDAAAVLASGEGLLYDVVYGGWPTPLAAAWQSAGAPAVNGLGMLVQQAVRQIRVFAGFAVDQPLPAEEDIVDVMRSALVGD